MSDEYAEDLRKWAERCKKGDVEQIHSRLAAASTQSTAMKWGWARGVARSLCHPYPKLRTTNAQAEAARNQ
jgi:hypothetical protein